MATEIRIPKLGMSAVENPRKTVKVDTKSTPKPLLAPLVIRYKPLPHPDRSRGVDHQARSAI